MHTDMMLYPINRAVQLQQAVNQQHSDCCCRQPLPQGTAALERKIGCATFTNTHQQSHNPPPPCRNGSAKHGELSSFFSPPLLDTSGREPLPRTCSSTSVATFTRHIKQFDLINKTSGDEEVRDLGGGGESSCKRYEEKKIRTKWL